MKRCVKCEEEKSIEEFYKNKATQDGLQAQCKSCRKKYREKNRDKEAERKKKYREKNRDKVLEIQKKYREKNRDKVAEHNKKYREKNRDKVAEIQKKYREENPLKTRAHTHKRRALKLETTIEPIDLNLVWDDSFGICFLCETPMDQQYTYPDPRLPSLEHVIPLSRGGTHTYDNLTYTHLQCNNRKLASLIEEMQLPLDPPTCYTE